VSTNYDGIIGASSAAAGSFTTITGSGVASIDDTTDTTSGTSGSVHTDGGVGIAKKLYVGGTAKVVGVLTAGDDIVSDTDSTDDLGTTGVRWANLWVDAIAVTDNITIGGNLTVNGTTTTVDTTNLLVEDPLILLNDGLVSSGTNNADLGLYMARGDADAAFVGWDESADVIALGTTPTGHTTAGNLVITDAQFTAAGATFSGTSSNLGTVTTIDINGGTIDGTAIGGAATAAGAFTTVDGTLGHFTTSLQLATGATVTGIEDSDTLNANSATLLATQQSIKAYVDNLTPAAGIQMTWATDVIDNDEGVGTVKADNGTFESIGFLYIDDVDANSSSINTFIDTLDDPTAANSAIIYLTKAGATTTAMKVFRVDGGVESKTTYSKVEVTGLVEVGSFSDGDTVGMIIAYSGDNGAGDGTVTQINAGDGFSFSAITGTGTIAVDGNLQDLDALGVVASDGKMIVGTGSGAYAYESGATLRTSIGCPALAAVNTFTKAQSGSITALSDGSTIAVDLSLNNHFSVTLGGNRALGNPSNIVAGTSGSIFITQDGTGSRTLSYSSYYDFAGGTAPTLTTTASKIDRIDYIARTTTSLHCVFTGDLS